MQMFDVCQISVKIFKLPSDTQFFCSSLRQCAAVLKLFLRLSSFFQLKLCSCFNASSKTEKQSNLLAATKNAVASSPSSSPSVVYKDKPAQWVFVTVISIAAGSHFAQES